MNSFTVCPLCKEKSSSSFFSMSSYWYCKPCVIAWKKRFPKTEYDETYYKGKSSLAAKLFVPISNIFYGIRQGYAGNKSKKVWIDVGAGEGGFLKTVKAKKRIGVEISLSGRQMMKENGIDTLSDKQFVKIKGLDADVISFWHVLEHVDSPWDYLKAAKRNLNRRGKIIIGIPNFQSMEFNFAKEYWFHLQPQFHLWHFSPKSLQAVLGQVGFSIDSIDYWSIEHHLTGILQSFINKTSQSKENVLHKLVKRGTGKTLLKTKDFFWSFFWMTIGLPIVFMFWIAGVITKKAGTIVVVASPTK